MTVATGDKSQPKKKKLTLRERLHEAEEAGHLSGVQAAYAQIEEEIRRRASAMFLNREDKVATELRDLANEVHALGYTVTQELRKGDGAERS